MINETVQITSEAVARSELFNTALIGLWIIFVGGFAILGSIFKNSSKWGNFWTVWLLMTFISGIVVTFLIISPESILSFIKSLNLINYKGGA